MATQASGEKHGLSRRDFIATAGAAAFSMAVVQPMLFVEQPRIVASRRGSSVLASVEG